MFSGFDKPRYYGLCFRDISATVACKGTVVGRCLSIQAKGVAGVATGVAAGTAAAQLA